jgi:hypothetical protein
MFNLPPRTPRAAPALRRFLAASKQHIPDFINKELVIFSVVSITLLITTPLAVFTSWNNLPKVTDIGSFKIGILITFVVSEEA